MKTLFALALGIGFLAFEARAKTSVAFLGIDPDSDPLFGKALSTHIRWDLAADTALTCLPTEAVEGFLVRASLEKPDVGPSNLPQLKLGLEANYYAFGRLEDVEVANKRIWWKPWTVNTSWTQTLRLRVVDGATGETVYDGQVPVEIPEKSFLAGPDQELSRKGALEQDGRKRRMLPLISSEAAKALAKVVAEKAAGGAAVDTPEQ